MPTIIALDISLSMLRPIPGRSEDNPLTYQQLAQKGISQLLDFLAANSKLEYVALVAYSTTFELKVDFTRDYDQIRQLVKKIEPGDKACVVSLLKGVCGVLNSQWSAQNCQLVVFSDCGMGFGSTSLKNYVQALIAKQPGKEPDWKWLQLLKPVKLNFVCMGLHSDSYFSTAITLYQQLFEVTELKAQMYLPKPPKEANGDSQESNHSSHTSHTHKSELGRTAMFDMIERLSENYKPYEAILKCGGYFRLESPIILWPPPQAYDLPGKSEKQTIRQRLEVCGFLTLAEIGSPASLSRHIILPKVERDKPTRRTSEKSTSSSKGPQTPTKQNGLDPNSPNYEFEKLEQEIRDFYTKDVKYSDEHGESDSNGVNRSSSNAPPAAEQQKESLCVLLHGALKVENLAALVLLHDSWYGYIYSFADSKKKANLMLNILPPGNNVVPWLGDFRQFGFGKDLLPGENSAFPVKAEKRSYSQSCVVWIRRVSLQSDIQKVLRHAKKMPEKTQHFYKELNRIRRAALSIGFIELLESMATLFEKESIQLQLSGANPECSMQLKHAAIELRKPMNRDLKISIAPVQKTGGTLGDGLGTPGAPGFVF